MPISEKVISAFEDKLHYFINELDLKSIYPKYIELVKKIFDETNIIYDTTDITLTDLSLLLDNRRKTKSRWLKEIMKNNKDLNQKKMRVLSDWSERHEPLIKYPYISSKTKKSLTCAIRNDLTVELYKLIIDESELEEVNNSECRREVIEVSNMLTSIPYNTSKKGSFSDIKNVMVALNKDVIVDDTSIESKKFKFVIKFNDDEPKSMLQLTNSESVKKALNKINQVLNSTDRKIINYLISVRTSDFINTGRVVVDLNDIVDNVFKKRNGENYLAVKTSIFKMKNIEGYIGNRKSMMNIGLISFFSFTRENNKDVVVVEIHNYIREEIIKKYTINLYKDVIDACPDDDCELILYFLQKQRLSLFLSNQPLTITVNHYDYFSNVLFFNNKRKDRNIARIVKCLEFVAKTDSVINYFRRIKDDIEISFKAVSKKEMVDLNYNNLFSDDLADFRNKLISPNDEEIEIY